jgi:hypothetical protein
LRRLHPRSAVSLLPFASTPSPDRAGRAIDTLTAGDFEVLEDGTRREIAAVTFIRANGAPAPGDEVRAIESTADEQSEAAKDGTRLFAIFLDEYHVAPGDGAAQVRAVLTGLIERALGPRDMVLVVKPLDSLLSLRLTRDLDVVRRSIAQFEASGVAEPRRLSKRASRPAAASGPTRCASR